MNMNLDGEKIEVIGGDELLEAQAHIWKHILNFINSMSLKCAVQLGIPDAIHHHGPHPMPLSQLVSALQLNPNKTQFIYRLMRLLTHSGFFRIQKVTQNNEKEDEGYMLTNSSYLLLKDNPLTQALHFSLVLDPFNMETLQFLSTWFRSDNQTPFDSAHGMSFWEYLDNKPKYGDVFNASMANDARLVISILLGKYKHIFDGLGLLVDVGGGTGTVAKAIAEAFPETECIVFDLPRVVTDFKGEANLKYVAGDMFEAIPPADMLLLKLVLHDWSDEECVKILKNCKLAITSNGNKGKLIVIDTVVDTRNKKSLIETQLLWDMLMMISTTGKEREEKEWVKLIKEAGFSTYKISPIIGFRSLIEIYP